MASIDFWKDKNRKTVDPKLYSSIAESLSKELAKDCENDRGRPNKRSQIRKFYDEITRLNTTAKVRSSDWENILPLVSMVIAKAVYARGRGLVSDNFVEFIRSSVEQVESPDDLNVFASFFEALMGFYRLYCPVN